MKPYAPALELGDLFPVHSKDARGICTCSKGHRCDRPGKHPATLHGCLDATRDERAIERWLGRGYRLGLHTENVFVLDFDPRAGGDERLAELERQNGPLPDSVRDFSGGGGFHWWGTLPAGDVRWRARLAPGIDIKAGRGRYVIVPPSLGYTWDASPEHTILAEVPAWVLRLAIRFNAPTASPATGRAATSLLGRAFTHARMAGREIDASRLEVRCPWESLHTTRGGSSSSTVVFSPTEKRPAGIFFCAHTSHGCDRRTTEEALEALPPEAVRAAVADLAAEKARLS